ncbi:MAG: SBBP repeat-containing protein [Candidatus Hodarchaeota archaeon]
MTKFPLMKLFGSMMLLSILIFSFSLSFPVFRSNNFISRELEEGIFSSSILTYLRDRNVPVNVLTEHSDSKKILLPSSGFIQNLGQINDDTIHYYYCVDGQSVGFSPSSITFGIKMNEEMESMFFCLNFLDSNLVVPMGRYKMSHYTNYFYGGLQITNVPAYEEVWYKDLYPGIDLRYYISDQGLKYDFVVHPGADSKQISIQVSESITLSITDQSVCFQACGHPQQMEFKDTMLRVYQADGASISARFIPKYSVSNSYGFQIGSYDPTQTLIIDPMWLAFSTFLGRSGLEFAEDIAVDTTGNSYVVGKTSSSDFPMVNAYDDTYKTGGTIFVSKLNNVGNGLVFSTFISSSDGYDEIEGIAVDADGNSYITGWTNSSTFPIKNAYQSIVGGSWDIFVTKFNSAGNDLIFSTFLGGSWGEEPRDIAVDTNGNSYVVGITSSSDFPMQNAYDNTLNWTDGFVTKLNTAGNGLIFSTYLGGDYSEEANGIAVDTNGNSYITGYTQSTDFPTMNAYQSNISGNYDTFVTKLNIAGNGLVFSTYLGGSGFDWVHGIAVDSTGNSYVAGNTDSSDFPVFNAYDNTHGGGEDVFISKINATGNGLGYSTYLGGGTDERGWSIAVDDAGNSYIAGRTQSSDFPTQNAYDDSYNGASYSFGGDAFVTRINTMGDELGFSTFLGGSEDDWGLAIAVDTARNSYITGTTSSTDFPLKNAYDSTNIFGDMFVTKFSVLPSISLNTPSNNSVCQAGTLIDLEISSIDGLSSVLHNWDGSANSTLTNPYDVTAPTSVGQHILSVYAEDTVGHWASATFIFTLTTTSTSTSSSAAPTSSSTAFFTVEVFLLALVSLIVIVWYRRKHRIN